MLDSCRVARIRSAQITTPHVQYLPSPRALKNSVYDVIHRRTNTLCFFHLPFISQREIHLHWLFGWKQGGRSQGVTTAVDDVRNWIFQSALSLLILNVESCCLNRSYYFQLIYKHYASEHVSGTSATSSLNNLAYKSLSTEKGWPLKLYRGQKENGAILLVETGSFVTAGVNDGLTIGFPYTKRRRFH